MGESHQGGSLRTAVNRTKRSQPTYDGERAGPPFSSEGPPAPPLHRVDAARDPPRARRARRHPSPGRARLGVAAGADRGRREGLVPFPAAVRRRAVGAPHRGRRTTAGPEAAEDDVADGGRWLEIQVDPSGYGARFGGITAFTDLVSTRCATPATAPASGSPSSSREPHPPPARRPYPRPAGRQYVDRGVVGFGLSNDERRGTTTDFAPAFEIAERAGLLLAPHGGELRGPEHIRTCLDDLHAHRLGHGVRAAEEPTCSRGIVDAGVALEVCPVSNVALGVYSDLTSVPLPRCSRPARRSRSGPTTRCCSAPGWPASTPPCAPRTPCPTRPRRARPDVLPRQPGAGRCPQACRRRHRRLAGRSPPL